jgi:hypothetical protein
MPLPSNPDNHLFEEPGLLDVLPTATAFFNATKAVPLVDLPDFYGSGVYGLYYRGDFPAYAPLAEANADNIVKPLYIGKAIPQGGRTGIVSGRLSRPLYNRIKQHRSSILSTQEYAEASHVEKHIRIEDFYCRYMVIPDKYWPLIASFETGLIIEHLPLWNVSLAGFGNHVPGQFRKGKLSEWDSLHPGRKHAYNDSLRHEEEAIFAKVKNHLQGSISAPRLFDK